VIICPPSSCYYPYVYTHRRYCGTAFIYSLPYWWGGHYYDAIDAYERGYREGREYADLEDRIEEREAALYNSYRGLMEGGLTDFRRGKYRQAANKFVAAAELNHADAASRLHAAHALFAVEEYRAAVVMLRRAYQLQPKIVALTYDIRDDYGDDDFDDHLEELEDEAEDHRGDASLWLLLGYIQSHAGDVDDAYDALRHAARLDPRDPLTINLLQSAGPGGYVLP
jgi:tetratricopeptide (TPR) repeat protein